MGQARCAPCIRLSHCPPALLPACLTCDNLAFSLQALPVCQIVAKFPPSISRMLGGMMIEMIQNADLSILHAIQGTASPALDTFMVGFTTLGEFGALWAIVGAPNVRHRHFRGNRARVRHWRHRTEKRHRAPETFPGRPRAHDIAHIAT